MTSRSETFAVWIGREVLPHEGALRAWLRRRMRNPGDVEDIIQECYCRMGEIEDVASIRSPLSYFFAVARNCVLQEMRRAKIVRIDTMAEIDELDLASDVPSSERIVTARSELERILSLIADLPPRARQIVEMRKIYGLSQREIAEHLGVSINVVENEASRGLKAVLERLTTSDLSTPMPAALDHDISKLPRQQSLPCFARWWTAG